MVYCFIGAFSMAIKSKVVSKQKEEPASTADISYSEEPKLVVRVLPSQMRFIKRMQDDMGMNRSDVVRFLINFVRFEHQTTRFVHSVLERHAWVGAAEKRLQMTDKEVIAWCVDFVRYLDENGLLDTMLGEIFSDKNTEDIGDAEQAVRARSQRVKSMLSPAPEKTK
jgi:hypothetical protein